MIDQQKQSRCSVEESNEMNDSDDMILGDELDRYTRRGVFVAPFPARSFGSCFLGLRMVARPRMCWTHFKAAHRELL